MLLLGNAPLSIPGLRKTDNKSQDVPMMQRERRCRAAPGCGYRGRKSALIPFSLQSRIATERSRPNRDVPA
jgi:hypothetical protein